jgi:hypothetical protein
MKNRLLLGFAILSLTAFGTNFAQEQPPSQAPPQTQTQQPSEAQPSVARMSVVNGQVNLQRGDSGEAVAGVQNTPVVAGDRVSTGTRSRLELTLDFANFLRLDERSEVKIADLTRTHIQVQVASGIVDYTVLKGNEADIEIDTPNATIHPIREGRYRIQINADSECDVIVREGEAEITTSQGSTSIQKGQMITVRGTDNPEYKTADAPQTDSWDDWNRDRDRQVQGATSWGHANHYYTGVNDLDAYGHWTNVPGYGDVWVPNQDSGWAPYREGRWVWEPYWGYTWVSYEPWGWAPYHYGRWFVNAGNWCWWPGPVYGGYRPFWSPAYVSFFGFSGRHFGVGVGFGFGAYGWLPIGPGDPFFPWWGGYRSGFAFVNTFEFNEFRGGRRWEPLWRGNGRGFSNFEGAFRDGRLRDGVTTMRAEEFGHAGVRRDFARVSESDFRGAKMVAGAMPVVPTRDSLRSSDRNVNGSSSQARGGQEHFFTRSTPRGSPESFQAGQSQMQNVVRQNGANGAGRIQSNPQSTPGNSADRSRGGATSSAAPNNGAQGMRQTPAAGGQSQQQGWQRFGDRGNSSQPASRDNGQAAVNSRGNMQPPSTQRQNGQQTATNSQQGGWQHFTPGQQRGQQGPSQYSSPRGYDRSGQYSSPRNSGRPELNLQRPIMTPRSAPPNGGYRGGGGSAPPSYSPRSAPSDGGYRGGGGRSSAPPSYSPRSAPSGGSRSSGSGGGGSSRSSSNSSGNHGRPH